MSRLLFLSTALCVSLTNLSLAQPTPKEKPSEVSTKTQKRQTQASGTTMGAASSHHASKDERPISDVSRFKDMMKAAREKVAQKGRHVFEALKALIEEHTAQVKKLNHQHTERAMLTRLWHGKTHRETLINLHASVQDKFLSLIGLHYEACLTTIQKQIAQMKPDLPVKELEVLCEQFAESLEMVNYLHSCVDKMLGDSPQKTRTLGLFITLHERIINNYISLINGVKNEEIQNAIEEQKQIANNLLKPHSQGDMPVGAHSPAHSRRGSMSGAHTPPSAEAATAAPAHGPKAEPTLETTPSQDNTDEDAYWAKVMADIEQGNDSMEKTPPPSRRNSISSEDDVERPESKPVSPSHHSHTPALQEEPIPFQEGPMSRQSSIRSQLSRQGSLEEDEPEALSQPASPRSSFSAQSSPGPVRASTPIRMQRQKSSESVSSELDRTLEGKRSPINSRRNSLSESTSKTRKNLTQQKAVDEETIRGDLNVLVEAMNEAKNALSTLRQEMAEKASLSTDERGMMEYNAPHKLDQ